MLEYSRPLNAFLYAVQVEVVADLREKCRMSAPRVSNIRTFNDVVLSNGVFFYIFVRIVETQVFLFE